MSRYVLYAKLTVVVAALAALAAAVADAPWGPN